MQISLNAGKSVGKSAILRLTKPHNIDVTERPTTNPLLQSKMDGLLKTISDYSASIPGAGAVVSMLKELVNTVPVEDLAEEYVFFYRKVLGSVPADFVDVSFALGLLGMFHPSVPPCCCHSLV